MTVLWFSLIGAILFTLIIASTLIKFRSVGFILIAVVWLAFAYNVPQYMGFPIESSMVGNRQALVLFHKDVQDKIYLLVRFAGETEPRFVIMPKTDANEESLRLGGGMTIIQFNSTDNVSHVDMNNSDEFAKPTP